MFIGEYQYWKQTGWCMYIIDSKKWNDINDTTFKSKVTRRTSWRHLWWMIRQRVYKKLQIEKLKLEMNLCHIEWNTLGAESSLKLDVCPSSFPESWFMSWRQSKILERVGVWRQERCVERHWDSGIPALSVRPNDGIHLLFYGHSWSSAAPIWPKAHNLFFSFAISLCLIPPCPLLPSAVVCSRLSSTLSSQSLTNLF